MNARHVLWRSNSRHLLSVHIARHRIKLTAARLQDATAEKLSKNFNVWHHWEILCYRLTFWYKRNMYLPMITWNMIDTILHRMVGRYEYPVMPLNPRMGKIRAVIIASHIDKLIKKGVQKLWSRRNLIITMMVSKLPNVPIEIKFRNRNFGF